MRTPAKSIIKRLITVVSLLGVLGFTSPMANATGASDVEDGRKLAFDRKKGNCLACHQIAGGKLAGNIGPPLVAMRARFPDFDALKAHIADARTKNPNTIMPPFGPHEILSDREIRLITRFIHTL